VADNWTEDTKDGKDVLVYSFLGAGVFFQLCSLLLPVLKDQGNLVIAIKESVHSLVFQ